LELVFFSAIVTSMPKVIADKIRSLETIAENPTKSRRAQAQWRRYTKIDIHFLPVNFPIIPRTTSDWLFLFFGLESMAPAPEKE
jgi:hypothetical protein